MCQCCYLTIFFISAVCFPSLFARSLMLYHRSILGRILDRFFGFLSFTLIFLVPYHCNCLISIRSIRRCFQFPYVLDLCPVLAFPTIILRYFITCMDCRFQIPVFLYIFQWLFKYNYVRNCFFQCLMVISFPSNTML